MIMVLDGEDYWCSGKGFVVETAKFRFHIHEATLGDRSVFWR